MGESKEERIERLLSEGLELYGVDEISSAIVSWEKVLEIDSHNRQAQDYLRTADRRRRPRAPRTEKMAGAVNALLQEARALAVQGDFAAALDLLRSASGPGFSSLEFEATVELVRSRLYQSLRQRLGGDLQAAPRVCASAAALEKYNLPPDAGFLLSIVDGVTALDDLVSLSGMDPFEALQNLCALIDAGIVEMAS